MKKNTKIFALVMSIAMLFSAFSLSTFAMTLQNKADDTLVENYVCLNFVNYTASDKHLFVEATLRRSVTGSSDMVRVVAQAVIGYIDSTFDIDYQSSPEGSISSAGRKAFITANVYGDTTKMVRYLANDSHYVVNGEAYSLGGTWYAGEDF